ncbi:MAG: tyrosine--tRNA ligase [Caldilineaceae bacterium]|nr:tyrosine--tRNA ligase [Caldilineaceae bacterium]
MTQFPPVEEQMRILMRGVDFGDDLTRINMEKELRARLEKASAAGRPLRVYCGFDPTSSDLHLGHTVPLRKLRQFQELGHEVVFLIGTFTGTIGDPSDKESARQQQTLDAAMEKARTFTEQAFRILDRQKTLVEFNHKWLGELSFGDVIDLASNFTVQQFLTRDNFSKRHAKGDPIWLHEFFYALMQGYDAVALNTDVQIGGTDQLFNLMAGRKLMEARGADPQVVLTFPILVGTDGTLRMSKSTGNSIGINEASGVIFTKVLSLPDHTFRNFAELVTRWSQTKIDGLLAQMESGQLNPQEAKALLAWEIVSIFHGDEAADQAAEDARRMFAGDIPSDAPEATISATTGLLDLMNAEGITRSNSEARRLVQQGGVRLNGDVVEDVGIEVTHTPGRDQVLQVGKRRYLRIVSA